MTHQLLLNAKRGSSFVQPRTIAVTQRVPADRSHFQELVGIQLLLMNTLGPLIRGERMTAEYLDTVLRQVQSTKARKAQELLARRASIGRES